MISRIKININTVLILFTIGIMPVINGSEEKRTPLFPKLFDPLFPKELHQKLGEFLPFKDTKNLRLINKGLSSLDTVDENIKKFAYDSVKNNVITDIGLWRFYFEYPVLQKTKKVQKQDKKQHKEYRKKVQNYYDDFYNKNYDHLYQNLFAHHCPVEKLENNQELIIGPVKIGKEVSVLDKNNQKILRVSGRECFYKNKENEFVPNEQDPQICWLYRGYTLADLLNAFQEAGIKPKKIVLSGGQNFLRKILDIISANPTEESEIARKSNCIALLQNTIVQNPEGNTIFVYACYTNNTEQIWEYLDSKNLDSRDYLGNTLLHHACKAGNAEIVQLLIEKGISLNSQDIFGNTPLHHICWGDREYTDDMVQIVSILLEAKANPNILNDLGKTPLDHIVSPSSIHLHNENKIKIQKLLIQDGAKDNRKKLKTFTVLVGVGLVTGFGIAFNKFGLSKLRNWLAQRKNDPVS